jgi:hypothetical protein
MCECVHEYVLVRRDELEALKRRADGFDRLECRLDELTRKEELMAAEQSAEAQALEDAIGALNAELDETEAVDTAILAEVEGLKEALGKVQPVTPEQVNAVMAATSRLTSLTQRLKGVEPSEGAPAPEGAGGGQESGGGTSTSEPGAEGGGDVQPVSAPSVSGISPVEGPAEGGGTATISGSNLQGAGVTFRTEGAGDAGAEDVVVAEDGRSLTCTVPAAPGGSTATVIVATPGGEAQTTYTYQAAAS